MAASCGYEYTRNRIEIRLTNTLLHTHSTSFEGNANLLYVVRDPRETLCSAARALSPTTSRIVYDEKGMIHPSFADYVIKHMPGATCSMKSHLNACLDSRWTVVRFEDVKRDPLSTLTHVVKQTGHSVSQEVIRSSIEELDFNRLKKASTDDRFLAKSSIDTWRTLLSAEVIQMLNHALGDAPRQFGYFLEDQS
ncbi:hypothetical protein GCM10009069_05290 [Algimonas arctica]|uniref:Sulfotransferase domain-containing protein n=1 Tax=Algimonas arctica TaxID=1479486 RepID=A0A8J3CLS9_9PROT|nr:hypothetical protein GCM10009069_05290 [Algimonas arctica]